MNGACLQIHLNRNLTPFIPGIIKACSYQRYEDNCGVYWPFETDRNVPIECNSDESHTPGTFCVKITKQGPRGFICEFIFLSDGGDNSSGCHDPAAFPEEVLSQLRLGLNAQCYSAGLLVKKLKGHGFDYPRLLSFFLHSFLSTHHLVVRFI